MKVIGFYIFYAIFWVLSWLPLRLLYWFSDVFFVFLFYVVKYRRKLVYRNLSNSFPEKGKAELRRLQRQYFRFLSDNFVESLYLLHLTPRGLQKRYIYSNPELLNSLYAKGKSIVAVFGHYGNWDWLAGLPLVVSHKVLAIYRPLQNSYFDKLIKGLREKFGLESVAMKRSLRRIMHYHKENIPSLTLFLSDQKPGRSEKRHKVQFLNQTTPVYEGAERIAKKLDMAVVYVEIRRKKRGVYQINFSLLAEKPRLCAEHEITRRTMQKLEQTIRQEPQFWLWSHNRWNLD